jgi:hypothetical protein
MKALVTFLSLLSIVSTAHADDSGKALYPKMFEGSYISPYNNNGYNPGYNTFINRQKCEENDRAERARAQTSAVPNATDVRVYLYTKDSSTMMGTLAEDYFVFYRNEKKEPMFAKVAVTKAGCSIVGLDLTKGYEIDEKN